MAYTQWKNSDNAAIASKIRPFGNLVNLFTKSSDSITTASITEVVPTAGAQYKNYITSGLVTNAGTVGVWVNILDEGDNVLYTGYAGPGNGFIIPPGVFTTTEDDMNVKIETESAGGIDVRCTLVGYVDLANAPF